MAKNVADDLTKVYIWQLTRAGLFASPDLMAEIRYKDDIISYVSTSIRYKNYIQVSFPNSAIRQDIKLTTTPCYIPGKRMWFECPHCRRRCGTLYLSELGYFSCRLCLSLGYESQRKNYRKKSYDFLNRFENYFKAIELTDRLKRFSYSGRPTTKMKKVDKLFARSIFF